MDSQKQQAAERIKEANNILVTVSNNPSVDQLAACIGVTLALNKMGKHATAVFSGNIPSTIEFLQPEKTIEKNTDSLRDFIIALDKSKADKLRYKVEDRVVKIFITPYKTSINEKDLEFSQGDFNVDVVLALGVHSQAELDQAITSHGRILHDATVVTLNVKPGGELGSINWLDPNASSLSELGVQLLDMLDKKLVDGQIATAMLTGIVAETERFSNAKTSPQTMSISAELMAEGANQQLVATKLEAPAPPPAPVAKPISQQEGEKPNEETPPKPDDGTLEITHDDKSGERAGQEKEGAAETPTPEEKPAEEEHHEEQPAVEPAQPEAIQKTEEEHVEPEAPIQPPAPEEQHETVAPQIHIDEHGSLTPLEDLLPPKPSEPPTISHHNQAPRMVIQPPTTDGLLTPPASAGFGDQEEPGLALPSIEAPTPVLPSEPNLTMPNGPVGHTIMPPEETAAPVAGSDDESPSGGAARSDSFLVGSGSMPAHTLPAGQPPLPSTEPITVQPPISLPATDADAQVGRTLSDIERDVHSAHTEPVIPEGMDSPGPATNDNILPPPSSDGPQIPIIAPTDNVGTPSSDQPTQQAGGTLPVAQPASDQANANDPSQNVTNARDAVAQAINGSSAPSLDPIASLNAQPVNLPMGDSTPPLDTSAPTLPATPVQPWVPPTEPAQPPAAVEPVSTQFDPAALHIETDSDPDAPPPVPPPMMPPTNPY
jgi:hypothetical protein